jgi:chromate transporter
MAGRVREWLGLFGVFCKIGALTFGGGIAMLPILERELVAKRGWASSEELLDYFAIGQSTPGIIAVNTATFIGCKRAGVVGGIAATAGIVTPSLVIISLIASGLENFAHIPLVGKALLGINVAVAALLTAALWSFARKTVTGILGILLFLAAFGALFFFHVNSILIIAFGAAAGIIAHQVKAAKEARP